MKKIAIILLALAALTAVLPLNQIKYLFNIDMIGDDNPVQYCEVSDAGMSQYPKFEKVNSEQRFFDTLNKVENKLNRNHESNQHN